MRSHESRTGTLRVLRSSGRAGSILPNLQPIIAGARIRIWVGAIFWVPSEQTLERQILARVTFAPELGFIDSG